MSQHILVPIDESNPSDRALEYALESHQVDDITVVHVLDPAELDAYGGVEAGMMADFAELQEQRREDAESLMDDVRTRARAAGIDVATEILTGRPARTIVQYAEDNEVDHIVLGSHGRTGAGRILLGSVAETITRRSPVPVTIIR